MLPWFSIVFHRFPICFLWIFKAFFTFFDLFYRSEIDLFEVIRHLAAAINSHGARPSQLVAWRHSKVFSGEKRGV